MTPAILGGRPAFERPIPFSRPALPAMEEVEADFRAILESGMVTKGQRLKELEAGIRQLTGAPFCAGVSSCTLGLLLVFQALMPDGDVVVPSFSFIASFHGPRWIGRQLRFVDCESDTFSIDPQAVQAELERGGVGAVVATHIFGNPPDLDTLESLCSRYGVPLVLDSAHGFGAHYNGVQVGARGDAEVFSASPTKLLAAGEGGFVTTRREDIFRHVEVGREYGNPGNYDCLFPGLNARQSELHAVLGLWALRNLSKVAERRQQIAARYRTGLQSVPGVSFQTIRPGCRSSYKDFAILIDADVAGIGSKALMRALEAEGIPTRAYFDPPGHRQTAFQDGRSWDLPRTEWVCSRIICLPIHTWISDADVDKVCEVISTLIAQAPALPVHA